jgi:hypothetical protein
MAAKPHSLVEWPTVEEVYNLYKKEDINNYSWDTKLNIPFYNKKAFGWDTQTLPAKEKYSFSNTTYPWNDQQCLPLKIVYKQRNTTGIITRSNPTSTPISWTPSVSETKRSESYNFKKDENYYWLSLEEAYQLAKGSNNPDKYMWDSFYNTLFWNKKPVAKNLTKNTLGKIYRIFPLQQRRS